MEPITVDPPEISGAPAVNDNGINPLLDPTTRDKGVAIRKIKIYPLAYNTQTNGWFYYPGIGKQARYINYSQSQGIDLTKSETMSLMQRMQEKLDSLTDDCRIVGWLLKGEVEFHYKNPNYILFQRSGTGIDSQKEPEEKRTIYAYSTESFEKTFSFPSGIDFENSYYYVGISGGCYYTGASGKPVSALLHFSASFNH